MGKVFDIIRKEEERQKNNIELIASENFVSEDVKKAMGSCLTNKYAEGYPVERTSGNKGRYYGGCEVVNELEEYCCDKWREAFNTDYHVNVQPHSGASANFAALMAVLKPGDTMLALDLNNGGHLTHGSSANFSGKLFNAVFYNLKSDGRIDYEDMEKKIREFRPKLVLAGASAYPRVIEFARIGDVIDRAVKELGDYERPIFMVDMAHIAGLILAGDHPSPFGIADIITTTTHKTLRGPRGGMIFAKPELAKKVDSAVFPGTQGGPLEHVIAGKAIAAEEACQPEYKEYIHQVVKNTAAMCDEFVKLGYDVITGGTDNHLFLLDFSKTHPNVTGKMVQDELDLHGITLNKNCVPDEKRKPSEASGVRIGLAAMTTKGWDEKTSRECAHKIDEVIKKLG